MVKTRLKYITISGCLVSSLFATETTTIELPKVPVATKVITIGGSEIKPREDRKRLDTTIPLPVSKPKVEKTVVAPVVEKVEVAVPVVAQPKEVGKKSSSKVAEKAPDKVIKKVEKKSSPKVVEKTPAKEIKEVAKQVAAPVVAKTVAPVVVKKAKKVSDVGMSKNGRVSTYLRGSYLSVDEVKKKLESAGFKVLGTDVVDSAGVLTSVVFTSDALSKLADKKDRGFMASLRVFINAKDKTISISNPLYFSRAFMQDDYDEKPIKEILMAINGAFDGLTNSKDRLKYTLLPKYQFMFSMPYFEDMIEVGKASSSQKLLEKVKKNLVFSQTLSKNRILVGVKLPANTASFIDKTGTKNAILLPYPVLLEDGVAKILDPKYYIALSYPKLKMSQFMKISSIPGEIEDDCKKMFK